MQVPFDPSVRLFVCPTGKDNSRLAKGLSRHVDSKTLVPFFKCFCIDNDVEKLIPCTFSTDIRFEFIRHLRLYHHNAKYSCAFCYDLEKSKEIDLYDMGIHLVRHIDAKHKNRRFQCNRCLYRSISMEHVNLHQLSKHKDFITKNQCQILLCDIPAKSDFYLQYFYDYNKTTFAKDSQFQCLYCSNKSCSLIKLVHHLVEKHPDFPLLYYLPYKNQSLPTNGDDCKNSSLQDGTSQDDFPTQDELALLHETYNCFFCDFQSISPKELKLHLCGHLFESDASNYDVFFDDWMNNFIHMQNSYLAEELPHNLCQICSSFNSPSSPKLEQSSDNVSVDIQKIHFILHACFKPIKCLLCAKESMGDFCLPDMKMRIIDHLAHFHRKEIQLYPEVRNSELFNFAKMRECSEQDWETFKKLLIDLSIVREYTDEGSWPEKDRKTLIILKSRYYDLLNAFNLPLKDGQLDNSNFFTDDESDS